MSAYIVFIKTSTEQIKSKLSWRKARVYFPDKLWCAKCIFESKTEIFADTEYTAMPSKSSNNSSADDFISLRRSQIVNKPWYKQYSEWFSEIYLRSNLRFSTLKAAELRFWGIGVHFQGILHFGEWREMCDLLIRVVYFWTKLLRGRNFRSTDEMHTTCTMTMQNVVLPPFCTYYSSVQCQCHTCT